MIQSEELKSYILNHFHYKDGVITRDDRKGGLGSIDRYGYLIIKVKGHRFKAHRIVWLLCKGNFPEAELDHINRNKLDNRIENLRESNRKQQIWNREYKANSDTGAKGIYIDTYTKGLKKKYATRVNKKIYRFYTLDEAIEFRKGVGL